MEYKTFEKIMETDRIESGKQQFKEYLEQYDFGSGKWNEQIDSHYVLEKLFHLLRLSRDLDNYGEVQNLLQDLIVDVAQLKMIEPAWIKPRMDEIKLATYYDFRIVI